MSNKSKIYSHIIDYIKTKVPDFKIDKRGKVRMFLCPICNSKPLSATLFPMLNYKIHCGKCSKDYYLTDIVKFFEKDKVDWEEKQILEHVRNILNLEITMEDEKKQLLDFYQENKWSLMPIAKNTKIPMQGQEKWQHATHYNREEWDNWIECQLNLAARTGKVSNITVLDFDLISTESKKNYRKGKLSEEEETKLLEKRQEQINKLKKILGGKLGNTLVMDNLGGKQFIYQYEEDISKSSFNFEGFHVDVQNEGSYILIPPSRLGKSARSFKDGFNSIIKMPQELKEFILQQSPKVVKRELENEIKNAIEDDNLKIDLSNIKLKNNGLEGCCNNEMIALGGKFRKFLSPKQTEVALNIVNKHLLEVPIEYKHIKSMCRELEKYTSGDETELAHEIVQYLKIKEMASEADIEVAVLGDRSKGEQKTRMAKALQYLKKEEKIVQVGRMWQLLKQMEWSDEIMSIGKELDFKVPYFDNECYFFKGDLLILGGKNKSGKSGIAMNIVKRLVDQGVKPCYIYNEPGGRWSKNAMALGLKDGDFDNVFCTDPTKIILKQDAVTIYDWVMPTEQSGGFARTDMLYSGFIDKLYKTNGFMICFVQLKEDDTFFAANQISQFPSLVARYVYEEENNGEYTKFKIDSIRDPKRNIKKYEIPCKYDFDTKVVNTIEELENKIVKKTNKPRRNKNED